MGKVIDLDAALWSRRHADAERQISDLQDRIEQALPDDAEPLYAVYALLSAALCVRSDGRHPEAWRAQIEKVFSECTQIINVKE